MSTLEIRTFTSAGWGENAYLVRGTGQPHCVVIDPGGGATELLVAVEREELQLDAILLTHAHIDHIDGAAALVRATGVPIYLHPDARPWYEQATAQARFFGVEVDPPPPPDRELKGGETLELGGTRLEVRDVPGHAPGHVVLYDPVVGVAFVGDVVFQGSIGRTDLPGGNHRQLLEAIRSQVLTLPDETELYPGHGPPTTVGRERVGNPFLAPMYGGGFA